MTTKRKKLRRKSVGVLSQPANNQQNVEYFSPKAQAIGEKRSLSGLFDKKKKKKATYGF